MKPKLQCPVCSIDFVLDKTVNEGSVILCPVCGAKVEITATKPCLQGKKLLQEPWNEINERLSAFALMKGYLFDENKEMIVEGLMEKHQRYGDFFCPCRFENVLENLCPCLETRMGQVRKEGQCRCGLFLLPSKE